MINGTLVDLVDFLIFEAIILAILGHFNLYIPEEQKIEVEKHYMNNECNDGFTIEMRTYVNEKWFFVLTVIALIILWGRYLRTNFEMVTIEIISNNMFNTVINASLIIFVFVISVFVLLIAPFFGEMKKVKHCKEYYLHTFGVVINI